MKFTKLVGRNNEYLYTRDGSPIIWVCRYKAGKPRIRKSLKTTNSTEARIKRDQLFELWLGLEPKKRVRISIEKVHKSLVHEKSSLVKASTIQSMEWDWKGMEPYFGGLFIDEITNGVWKNFCSNYKQKYPDRKLFNFYKHLTRILRFAHEKELIEKLPRLERPKDELPESKVYTNSEIDRLLNAADPVYMKFMIPMAYELGMRTSEITQLPKEFMDFKDDVIRLPASYTKTGQPRIIPMGHLRNLLKEKYDSTNSRYLFPSPISNDQPIGRDGHKKAWNRCKRLAKVEGRFYDLRHTAATRMAKTISPVLAAKILGHDLKIFYKVYCKPSEQDLKEEFEKMRT